MKTFKLELPFKAFTLGRVYTNAYSSPKFPKDTANVIELEIEKIKIFGFELQLNVTTVLSCISLL